MVSSILFQPCPVLLAEFGVGSDFLGRHALILHTGEDLSLVTRDCLRRVARDLQTPSPTDPQATT